MHEVKELTFKIPPDQRCKLSCEQIIMIPQTLTWNDYKEPDTTMNWNYYIEPDTKLEYHNESETNSGTVDANKFSCYCNEYGCSNTLLVEN